MSKMIKLVYFILFLPFLSPAQVKVGKEFKFDVSEKEYPISRTVKNVWQIKNETADVVNEINFSIYLPVLQTSYQSCEKIEADYAGKLSVDELGNQVFTVHLKQMAPYSSFYLRVKSTIKLSKTAVLLNIKPDDKFIKSEEFIEADHLSVKEIAQRLKGKDNKETAEKSFQWVSSHLEKGSYSALPHGAVYALKNKQVDCTEFTFLMTALLRANEIPARVVGGYLVKMDKVLSAEEYHNWLEYKVDGKWDISDPYNKNHAKDKEFFIAYKIDGGESETLMNGHQRFSISNNKLTVLME
jgi:transglutaminase-like putative cysteine protease